MQVWVCDPGIVDQDVEAGEFLELERDDLFYTMWITDIAANGKDTNPKTQQFPAYFFCRDFSSRPVMMRLQPCCPNFRAIASPMPRLAPGDQGCATLEALCCFSASGSHILSVSLRLTRKQSRMLIRRGLRILF